MQVTVLGSGPALPTHRRASAGYLVEWRQGALLLDPSAGTYMRALKAGLDSRRLLGVALSHFHPDHTADLPGLLWARRQEGEWEEPLVVVGPEGTGALVESFRASYGDWLETPLEVRGYPCSLAGLAVRAFSARHCEEAVCLRLEAEGASLAYSGDTADCEGLREACRGADLALLECSATEPIEGHMTPADCAAVVEAARPKAVLLTHIGPGVESAFPLAEDGLVVPV